MMELQLIVWEMVVIVLHGNVGAGYKQWSNYQHFSDYTWSIAFASCQAINRDTVGTAWPLSVESIILQIHRCFS